MKRIYWFAIVLTIVISMPVGAHPMGNFSINHYSRFQFVGSELRLHYVIDFAEIPTFQEMRELDPDGDKKITSQESEAYLSARTEQFRRKLELVTNNRAKELQIRNRRIQVLPGAGGLPVLQVIVDFEIPYSHLLLSQTNQLDYKDNNFPERIGWKEIVIAKQEAAKIIRTTAADQDRSSELTKYPQDPTTTAPQELSAQIVFGMPSSDFTTDEIGGSQITMSANRNDRFTALISRAQLTPEIIFFSLLVAFCLGAMHAMSPGHGKTIVAGYLVGSRGTAWHAILLGATVTLTHTIGVFVLGLLSLYFSKYILPEKLYPWIGILSGFSIVVIGIYLFWKRLQNIRHVHSHSHHHRHDHDEHGHSHVPADPRNGQITWKSLLTIGISGGALPCPSALVVLLSAISLHRIGFGLLLIVAFSLGLAIVLTSIGMLMVYAAAWTQRFRTASVLVARLPIASSLIIALFGFLIALQAFHRL